jgi:hypothetical protein
MDRVDVVETIVDHLRDELVDAGLRRLVGRVVLDGGAAARGLALHHIDQAECKHREQDDQPEHGQHREAVLVPTEARCEPADHESVLIVTRALYVFEPPCVCFGPTVSVTRSERTEAAVVVAMLFAS